eukprot:TRINITY_DN10055_c0_g1_i2.p1 TRINITY_DN10055_c0_g1~~TRINITY_DN10055_c0_g1_i2.p1  ORF type:complete len:855 (+),score=268.89 TRINITY_DN10055_c0_g1_i2:82-2565(+)
MPQPLPCGSASPHYRPPYSPSRAGSQPVLRAPTGSPSVPRYDPLPRVSSHRLPSPGASPGPSTATGLTHAALASERAELGAQNQAMRVHIEKLEQVAQGRQDNVREIQQVLHDLRRVKGDLAADNTTLRQHLREKEDALGAIERQRMTVSESPHRYPGAMARGTPSPPRGTVVSPTGADAVQRLRFLESVNTSLGTDNQSLNRSLDHLQKSIAQLHQQKLSDAAEIESLIGQLEQERRRVSALEREAALAGDARHQAEEAAQAAIREVGAPSARERELALLLERQRGELEARRQECAGLAAQLQQAAQQLDAERAANSRLQSQLACSPPRSGGSVVQMEERHSDALRQQLRDAVEAGSRAEALLVQQGALLYAEQQKGRDMQAEMQRDSVDSAALRHRVADLERQLAASDAALRSKERMVHELRCAQAAVASQRDDAQAAALKASTASMRQEAAAAGEALRAAECTRISDTQRAESDMRELRLKAEQAEARAERERAEADALRQKLQSIAGTASGSHDERTASLQVRAERAEEALEHSTRAVTDLQRELADSKALLAQAEARHDRVVQDAASTNAALREQLAESRRGAAGPAAPPAPPDSGSLSSGRGRAAILQEAERSSAAEAQLQQLQSQVVELEVGRLQLAEQRDDAVCELLKTRGRIADAEAEMQSLREGELAAAIARAQRLELQADAARAEAEQARRQVAHEQSLRTALELSHSGAPPPVPAGGCGGADALFSSWRYEARRVNRTLSDVQRTNSGLERALMEVHSCGAGGAGRPAGRSASGRVLGATVGTTLVAAAAWAAAAASGAVPLPALLGGPWGQALD